MDSGWDRLRDKNAKKKGIRKKTFRGSNVNAFPGFTCLLY